MNKSLLSLCVLCFGVAAAHAISYDNSSISSQIIYFGNPNTATYGQTFTAPSANVLNDWTFYLENQGGPAQNFEFFVMAWNGAEATGPVLYQSALQTVGASQNTFKAYTVDPNLTLSAGQQYVMFINESGLNGAVNGQVAMGGNNNASPLGGSFEYLNNGDNFSQVTSTPWSTWSVAETAYLADFSDSAVPDAGSSIFLLSCGLGALAAMRRWFGNGSVIG